MEEPECPVCLQAYDHDNTIPRVLNCGHTICETCLSQLPQKHPQTIRCPACTHLIKFPTHQGPSSLPKNIDLLHYSNASQQAPHQGKEKSNSSHKFVSYSWSDEFYLKWKGWILPKDAILVEPMSEKSDIFDVLEGELTLEKSNLVDNLAGMNKRKVSLVRVSSCNLDVSCSNLFEFSYIVNAMNCLSGMVEETRDELVLILKACFRNRGVCCSYGLMYDSSDECVYLACEKSRESVLERIRKLKDVEGGGLCFEMITLEICEALMGLHSKGLVLGCIGPSCFSADDFGHVCINLNEILVTGRKVNRIILDGNKVKQNIGESDMKVILTNLLKEDVFISPEVLFELLLPDGVCNRRSSFYSVDYNSDVWSLACLLIRFLVGRPFLELIENDMHSIYPLRSEENESDCPGGYREWMSKVGYLLENQLGSKSAMLQEILSKCLNFHPTRRPLVTDVWKCIRQLIFNPHFDALITQDAVILDSKIGCCLVLGELCKLPQGKNESSETDAINSHSEAIADQTGGVKIGKGIIEALASSCVKSTNMQGHLDCVTGLAVGGGFLFSSSFDRTVNVWSLQDFKHVHSFRGHEHRVMAVIFLEGDMPVCISGDSEGNIFIWGISEPFHKEPIKKWNEEKDWRYSGIHALAFYRTQYLYTGSGDKTVKAWSLQDYTLSCTMTGHRSVVSALVVSEGVLYSGSWDGTIRLWSVNDHSSLAVLEETGSISSVSSLSASQQLLVAAHENGFIKFWKDDVFKRSMQVHRSAIFATALDGKWLFSGGWDRTIHIQELLGDELHLDIRNAGTIACDSVITSLLYWQGKLFVGFGDRLIKVYYFGR